MGAFVLRRLAFGFLAMFVALSGSFFFFAAHYAPLHFAPPMSSPPLLHSYWVWLRGSAGSMRQAGIEPATSRSGGARSIP